MIFQANRQQLLSGNKISTLYQYFTYDTSCHFNAGMHILADLKHGIEDQTAHKALLAHGIDSLPLSVYCSEPIQRSALVLGFSGVPRNAMPRLTKKLGEKLRSLH